MGFRNFAYLPHKGSNFSQLPQRIFDSKCGSRRITGQGFESLSLRHHVVADCISFATTFFASRKSRLSLIPSLLLSEADPLRWAPLRDMRSFFCSGSHILLQHRLCQRGRCPHANRRVVATPYCSLHPPQAALATVPSFSFSAGLGASRLCMVSAE